MRMKKILVRTTLVIIISAAAVLAYAQWRLGEKMTQFAGGATLHFGTLEVIVPPLPQMQRHWLPPEVRLGDIDLMVRLSESVQLPLHLHGAALHLTLLERHTCMTSREAVWQPSANAAPLQVRGLSLCGHHDELGAIAMHEVAWSLGQTERTGEADTAPSDGESTHLVANDVVVHHSASDTYLPALLQLDAASVHASNTGTTTPWNITVHHPHYLFRLDGTNTQRHATVRIAGDTIIGGRTGSARVTTQPFVFDVEGSVVIRSHDELVTRGQELIRLARAIDTEQVNDPSQLLLAVAQAWSEFGLMPEHYHLQWQGAQCVDAQGKVLVAIAPSHAEGTITLAPREGMRGVNDWQLGKLSFATDGVSGELADVHFTSSFLSLFATYQEMWDTQLRYYRQIASATNARIPAYLGMLLQYPYPTETEGSLHIGHMQWTEGPHVGDYRDIAYTFAGGAKGVDGTLQVDVKQQTLPEGFPAQQWEGGHLAMTVGVEAEWPKVQHAVLHLLDEPKMLMSDVVQSVLLRPYGVKLGVETQGGNLGFATKLDVQLRTDLHQLTLSAAERTALDAESYERSKIKDAVYERIIHEAIARGAVDTHLTIDQLSKLQALINAVSAGSGDLAVQQVTPFTAVDPAKDHLEFSLGYHDGKFKADGALQPILDGLLAEWQSGAKD